MPSETELEEAVPEPATSLYKGAWSLGDAASPLTSSHMCEPAYNSDFVAEVDRWAQSFEAKVQHCAGELPFAKTVYDTACKHVCNFKPQYKKADAMSLGGHRNALKERALWERTRDALSGTRFSNGASAKSSPRTRFPERIFRRSIWPKSTGTERETRNAAGTCIPAQLRP